METRKVYIAGHRGMVGGAILRRLEARRDRGEEIELITATHAALDLTDQAQVAAFMAAHKPDVVILAAARVGGIHANNTYPADFIHDNLMIAANVIGAAHAGWRGALDGVLEATIDAMEAIGAKRSAIRAVIGPAISQGAYEVGPGFLDDFMAEDPENQRFFANGEGDRYMFDLPAYGLQRLRQAGVDKAEWTRHCTYSNPDRFFSYRRATHAGEADYGRLISAIRL